MNVRYRVELSQAERDQLTAMLRGGRHAARKLKRAQILMAADNGATDAAIAASVAVGESTAVYRTKRRFVEGNLDLALKRRAAPGAASQVVLQGGGASGCYRLLQPAAGARTLDT